MTISEPGSSPWNKGIGRCIDIKKILVCCSCSGPFVQIRNSNLYRMSGPDWPMFIVHGGQIFDQL